jgi:hypothetical protein
MVPAKIPRSSARRDYCRRSCTNSFHDRCPREKFPGVPVVICGTMENWSNRSELDSHFTGTWLEVDPARTLEVALQLQPGSQTGYCCQWCCSAQPVIRRPVSEESPQHEDKLKFTYLSGLPMSSVLPHIRQTPSHTVILFGAINQDATGPRFVSTTQPSPVIAGAANASIFVLGDVFGRTTLRGSLRHQPCFAGPHCRRRCHEDSWRRKPSKAYQAEARCSLGFLNVETGPPPIRCRAPVLLSAR